MIDNVILLITGTLHQRSIAELVPKCHPLGSFEQMEAVNIAQTPAELYNAILVDTPLGEPLVEGGVGISTSASVCGLRTPGGDPDSELRPTHWLAFKLPLPFLPPHRPSVLLLLLGQTGNTQGPTQTTSLCGIGWFLRTRRGLSSGRGFRARGPRSTVRLWPPAGREWRAAHEQGREASSFTRLHLSRSQGPGQAVSSRIQSSCSRPREGN